MKKYLFPGKGIFYKANLHCHTTESDGNLSALQIKKLYQENGYSVVAFTDHEYLVLHNELTDKSFVALNGYEIATNDGMNKPFNLTKSVHLNLIAKNPQTESQVCYHPDYVWLGDEARKYTVKKVGNYYERKHTSLSINHVIEEANKNGFLVIYNHPAWSLHNYDDYKDFKNLFAIEVYNTGSNIEGFNENDNSYEDLLALGNKLNAVCSDDNHNKHGIESPYCDSFKGYTMIKAEKLDYDSIIKSLISGNYYSSCGPHFYEAYIENNELTVITSEVAAITVKGAGRNIITKYATKTEFLTETKFMLNNNFNTYFRIILSDSEGKKAYTNAYYNIITE